MDDVKGIMIDNIGKLQYVCLCLHFACVLSPRPEIAHIVFATAAKILERGEQLDILVEQSAQLTNDANDFKYEADDLRKRMCRQHARMIIILSIVGAVRNNIAFPILSLIYLNILSLIYLKSSPLRDRHAQVILLIIIIAIVIGVCTQIHGACGGGKRLLR